MTKKQYIKNPTRESSLPYWKTKAIKNNNIIVIDDSKDSNENGEKEQYFKLYHSLEEIPEFVLKDNYYFKQVDISKEIFEVVNIINNSYEDIKVSSVQMTSYINSPVFDNELWLFVMEKNSHNYVGLLIADVDKVISEGIIEWLQVLPNYRNQGIGKALVCKCLKIIKKKALFAVVCGQMENTTNPLKIYEKCGFNDLNLWNIYRK